MINSEQNKYVKIGIGSNIERFQLNLRSPEEKIYVTIGSDSVIAGTVNIERGKIEFGDRVLINEGTTYYCTNRIKIGNDVMFSWGCTVVDSNFHSLESYHRMQETLTARKDIEAGVMGKNKGLVYH